MATGGSANDAARRDPGVDAGIDMLGLIELMLRRKWLIIGTTLVVLALALAALWMVGPRYKATARLLIDPRELRIVERQASAQDLASDMVLVESQVEIITSEAVLSRVVESENLTSDEDFYVAGPDQGSGRTAEEVAMEGLAQSIKVSRPENTYILEIVVTAKQPAKAARLANAVAAAYTADQAAAAAGSTLDLSSSIASRLAELEARVKADEEKVAQYKAANGITTSDGRLLLETRLNDLSARLSAAVGETAQARSRYEVMQNAMAQRGDVSSVLSEGENATMVALRSSLTDAQRRLAELQQVLGPRHPRVGAAQAEVERAQLAIRAESERLVAATRDAWRAAEETERAIAQSLEQLTGESFQSNDRMIELRELERQLQASRLVYESYLVRARETAELGNIGARAARLIAPAAVPDRPAFPPRSMLAAAALVFGFGLGLFNAILADLLQRRRVVPVLPRQVTKESAAPGSFAETAAVGPTDHVIMTFAHSDGALSAGTALDLVRGLAAEGHETVLLDLADVRPLPGLADFSRGEASMAAVLGRDPYSTAHLMAAGDLRGGVDAARIGDTLATLAATYARVVINAGVLNGAANALVAPAIRMADHALLVVPGATMTADEREAFEALSSGALPVSVLSLENDRAYAHAA